jgi:hypothetical protein
VDTPLDSQAEVPFEGDVELPGQFGKGGFTVNPRITAPAMGPPPGTSLSTIPKGAYVNPSTGQPEMLTGPGGLVEKTRGQMNPFGFVGRGNPYWRAAIAGAEITRATPTANDAAPTNMWNQRPSGVGGMPGPQVVNPPTPYRPEDSPSFTAPAPATYPHMPWPDTGVAPAVGPTTRGGGGRATLPAVGPAAAAQQPNLGNYGASPFTTLDYRPNSGPNERNRGSPVATALDLSRLFGGGQPAPAPAARPAGILSGDPEVPGRGPAIVPGMNPTGNLALTGGNVRPGEIRSVQVPYPAPKPKKRSSTTSQGGGYKS